MSDAPPSHRATTVTFADGAVVCAGAELHGRIDIGANAVIHPRCRITATSGPIVIGANTVVEELACISNEAGASGAGSASDSAALHGSDGGDERVATSDGGGTALRIGSACLIGVGCVVEALSIGDGCVVEPKAVIGRGATIGPGCVIGATAQVAAGATVPDGTVVYRVDPEGDGGRSHWRHQPRARATNEANTLAYVKSLTGASSKHNLKRFHALRSSDAPVVTEAAVAGSGAAESADAQ